jgi:long-chain acyl-CoA synthetase
LRVGRGMIRRESVAFSASAGDGNIIDIVRLHAAVQPDQAAIVDGSRTMSYSELARLISRHAGYLVELGLAPRDRLGLILRDNADHLILMLAAASLGAATLSLNWQGKVDEKQQVAEAFGVKLLIKDAGIRSPAGMRVVQIDDAWRRGVEKATPMAPAPAAGSLAFRILLTSGTTGLPKGVEMTHSRILAWRASVSSALSLTSRQRHLSVLPLAFTGSFLLNLTNLLLGNTVELFPPLFMAEELVAAIRSRGITGITVAPVILRRLLALAQGPEPLLPELSYLVCLGAPISADERRAAVRRLSRGFFDNYGASGSGPITFFGAQDIEANAESVGRVVPLMEVEVVDDRGQPHPPGEIGLLRCRGPTVASAFCNAGTEAAGEAFRDGWYYPGELARVDQQGFIYLVGRVSEMILRGGSNIYPVEIEQALMRHPAVREVAVIGAPSVEYGEEVIAFVHASAVIPERDLLEICRRCLSSYKVPKEILFVDALPKNIAGKVLKADLLQMLNHRLPAQIWS